MNARLCKQLRGLARARSVGEPSRKLVMRPQVAYHADGRRRFAECAVNHPRSFRGKYRALKREARQKP